MPAAEDANIARHLRLMAASRPDAPALKVPRGRTAGGEHGNKGCDAAMAALAMADDSTLWMRAAPFLGLNASTLSAFSTGSPRMRSATSRPFCAERRTPYSFAWVSIISPYFRSPELTFLSAA